MRTKCGFRGTRLVPAIALVLMSACSSPTERVAAQTKEVMQNYYDTDPERKEWHLQVVSVTAVKQVGNQYQGVAKLAYAGVTHDVGIAITADGKNLIWKPEEGAYAFVLAEILKNSVVEEQVTNAVTSNDVSRAITTIKDYYQSTGSLPDSCKGTSNLCENLVTLGKAGTVVITLDSGFPAQLVGRQIVFVPTVTASNDLHWDCTSNVDSKYIAERCRQPLGSIPLASTASRVDTKPDPQKPESETTPVEQAASSVSNPPPPVTAQSDETGAASSMKPSFDCAKASTNVERIICSDPSLAVDDAEMATSYKANLAAAGNNASNVKQSQRAFIKTRNACDSAPCVADAYAKRRVELDQLGFVH